MSPFVEYLVRAFALGMVFLYGSVGEIITEKSGHLNLGIPGVMSVGAMCGCVAINAFYETDVPGFVVVLVAILATLAGGALMGALYSLLTVTLRANQNVTGLVLTTFGIGFTRFIMPKLSNGIYKYGSNFFRYPFAERTDALQNYGILLYMAIIIAVGASLVLNYTRVGLNLRAVGENPATADAAGVNISLYRYVATMIGCAVASLGGLYYIFVYSPTQDSYKTIEIFGWLAVALVIFALWKPYVSIIGSVVFGALYNISEIVPMLNLSIPKNIVSMLPYIITLIVLVITSIRNKKENQPPAGLGINYYREDR